MAEYKQVHLLQTNDILFSGKTAAFREMRFILQNTYQRSGTLVPLRR